MKVEGCCASSGAVACTLFELDGCTLGGMDAGNCASDDERSNESLWSMVIVTDSSFLNNVGNIE